MHIYSKIMRMDFHVRLKSNINDICLYQVSLKHTSQASEQNLNHVLKSL